MHVVKQSQFRNSVQMGMLLLFCSMLIQPLLVPAVAPFHAADREEEWRQQQFLASDLPVDLRVKPEKEQTKQPLNGCFAAVPPLALRSAVAASNTAAVGTPPCRTGMLYTQMTASDL